MRHAIRQVCMRLRQTGEFGNWSVGPLFGPVRIPRTSGNMRAISRIPRPRSMPRSARRSLMRPGRRKYHPRLSARRRRALQLRRPNRPSSRRRCRLLRIPPPVRLPPARHPPRLRNIFRPAGSSRRLQPTGKRLRSTRHSGRRTPSKARLTSNSGTFGPRLRALIGRSH